MTLDNDIMMSQIDLWSDVGCMTEVDLISYLLNTADGEILISYTKVYTEWRTSVDKPSTKTQGQRREG